MSIVQLSMKCGRWIVQCICNEIHWTPPPVLTLLKIGTEVWMNSSRELMMMMMTKRMVLQWDLLCNFLMLRYQFIGFATLVEFAKRWHKQIYFCKLRLCSFVKHLTLSLLRPHSFKDGSPGVPRNFSKTINGRSLTMSLLIHQIRIKLYSQNVHIFKGLACGK